MIAIAIQRPGNGQVDATTKISVANGFLAVTNIVFAYGSSQMPIFDHVHKLTALIYSGPCRFLRVHFGDADSNRLPKDSVSTPGN